MEYGEGTFFSEPWERLSLSPNRIRELGEIQPALSRISGILLPGTLFFVAGNTRVGGSYRSNMKAIHLFRLRVVTGIAALGLVAGEVTYAQAPSGPITAAPQPAGAPAAHGPNPVPLPAPRTTILGAWKWNPDESDDPRRRREDSRGSNGGYGSGRGRMGGGGYGGRRSGGESDEQREKMRELLMPSKTIRLSMTGAEVDLVDDRDHKRAFMTDGRKLQKSKDENYQEIAAKFDGTRLVSDEKDPRGNKMSRTFELSSDGRQLYETLHMTGGRSNTALVIRYVYDVPIQTRQ
jgi:hypothetical protein